MLRDAAIPFDGSVRNESRTPRGEVGGLAIFEGVLMRSRTGFAIAVRRPSGSIKLKQVPFNSLLQRSKSMRMPFLRGTAALGEMMVIGTRALRLSAAVLEGAGDGKRESKPRKEMREGVYIAASVAVMLAMLVLVPNLLATWALGVSEADYPFGFNVVAGAFRVALLLVYIAGLTFNKDVRRVFQYHGAEHKAVLALEEGGDVTVARARRHDTLHPRCGTVLLALVALLTIPGFALGDWMLSAYVSGFPDWHIVARKSAQMAVQVAAMPLLLGVGFELLKLCAAYPKTRWARVLLAPGFLLQRLTTRQPDDRQLEVAIVALFGALAISPHDREIATYTVGGLEDDESAPGYIQRSPARPAPPVETSETG